MFGAVQFFALFTLMLVTGIFWGPWYSLHRSMKKFAKEEFVKIVKIMSNNLASTMRMLMPVCLILMTLSVVLSPEYDASFCLKFAALMLMIGALVVTVAVEVPIVNEIQGKSAANTTFNLEVLQDKWLRFHKIRVFSAILSFACYSASML